MPKKKFSIEKKKVLMETWDYIESLEGDSEEEKANMALMVNTEASDVESGSEFGSESNSNYNEVFSNLTVRP